MTLARGVGGIIGVSGVLMLGWTGVAGADPGRGCTFDGVEPVGYLVSFIAQEFGHSGSNNPGHNTGGPFVPAEPEFGLDCNPTEHPSPPPRQP